MEIRQLLLDSLKRAAQMPDDGATDQIKHRNRSKNFVEAVAKRFEDEYISPSSSFRVFSKHNDKNRKEFGLNELLFDILVCDTSLVPSATNKKNIRYVTKALWQIESEFARDSQQAIFDFNKLVLGTSENKLFIGPLVKDIPGYLHTLAELAKYCNSNTYIALITHPADWKPDNLIVKGWKFEGVWKPI